jgi:hypothetical protein
MRIRRVVTLFVSLLLTWLAARSLGAQSISVRGVRGLIFGTVVPGVPARVLRTDAANSGQFEVRGPPPKLIQMTLTLPAALNGPAGATMPLSFATNDAGYSITNSIASQIAFDPNRTYTTFLITNRVGVFLGGTVSPSVGQRAGSYSGTVVLSVVVL